VEIQPGKRLGPYEIISLLGAGGMGEVYRARDTRLDRSVALKILPPRASATTMARERFEREARAISALQHPNICTLFDVGSDNGTEYLVMELLDGEPLADRIGKGPLPLDQVLRIGAQIADALAKAHRAGIVHRDLKPANVMLTRSGPKLLDFGLARRAVEPTQSQPLTGHDAPTAIEKPLTSDGMILGTLPYMAPEQLEAKATDARTDLFALGAVLYEMLTGRRAFQANSQASLITKIMSEQPPAIETLQPIAPASLNRLVMKCLAKDPDERWQSAADVADELRWIAEAPATQAVTKKAKPFAWIAAAALALIASGLGIALLRRPTATPQTVRFTIPPPENDGHFAINDPLFDGIAVSPDGRAVAYVAWDAGHSRRRLWLRRLDGVAAPLEGTEGAASPFWSPDSSSIGFRLDNKLKIATFDPPGVQNVCDITSGGVSATWMADGTIVFNTMITQRGLWAVPSRGGTPRKLLNAPQGVFDAVAPRAIGNTRSFFFSAVTGHGTDLWIGDLDGHARKLLDNAGRVAYDPPYVVFVREGRFFAQRFDERKLELTGDATGMFDGVWFYRTIGSTQADAGGGTLVWASALFASSVRWLDRSGRDIGEALPTQPYRNELRISPDGKRLLLTINDLHTLNGDLWMADLQRGSLTRLTFGEHDYDTPLWSADGRNIAYGTDDGGPPHIVARALGGGPERPLAPVRGVQFASDRLRDGRVLFHETSRNSNSDIFLGRAGGSAEPWLQTPASEGDAHISPDQRWVAYASSASGRLEIYIAPLDHHAEPVLVSNDGGDLPMWSRDGATLYWKNGHSLFAAPVHARGDTIEAGAPAKLYTASQTIECFDVAPDGRILVVLRQLEPMTQPLTAITNWKQQLDAKK
jgi:eukaryotic-like serine/threonine-protein kinase